MVLWRIVVYWLFIYLQAGVGLGRGDADELLNMVQRSKKATKRWRDCKVLLIDEVSMIDAWFFSNLCYIGE